MKDGWSKRPRLNKAKWKMEHTWKKKMERRVHLSAYIARRVAGTVEAGPKKYDYVLDQGKNPTSPRVFVRSGLSPKETLTGPSLTQASFLRSIYKNYEEGNGIRALYVPG